MNALVKKIKAKKPVRVTVGTVAGTSMVPVRFVFEDFEIPSGATAKITVAADEDLEFACTVGESYMECKPCFSTPGTFAGQVRLRDGQDKTLYSFPVQFLVYPFCGE